MMTINCARCKTEVEFTGKQWSRNCPRCGNLIILTHIFREPEKHEEQQKPLYKCRYCRDTGWLVIEKQVNEQLYEYAYRCFCQTGQNRKETGIPIGFGVDVSLRKWG